MLYSEALPQIMRLLRTEKDREAFEIILAKLTEYWKLIQDQKDCTNCGVISEITCFRCVKKSKWIEKE